MSCFAHWSKRRHVTFASVAYAVCATVIRLNAGRVRADGKVAVERYPLARWFTCFSVVGGRKLRQTRPRLPSRACVETGSSEWGMCASVGRTRVRLERLHLRIGPVRRLRNWRLSRERRSTIYGCCTTSKFVVDQLWAASLIGRNAVFKQPFCDYWLVTECTVPYFEFNSLHSYKLSHCRWLLDALFYTTSAWILWWLTKGCIGQRFWCCCLDCRTRACDKKLEIG